MPLDGEDVHIIVFIPEVWIVRDIVWKLSSVADAPASGGLRALQLSSRCSAAPPHVAERGRDVGEYKRRWRVEGWMAGEEVRTASDESALPLAGAQE